MRLTRKTVATINATAATAEHGNVHVERIGRALENDGPPYGVDEKHHDDADDDFSRKQSSYSLRAPFAL